jgi:hypothetical protein
MRSVETRQYALGLADEYHEEFMRNLDEVQALDENASLGQLEWLQLYGDRMQTLGEFWDMMADRLK